MINKIYVLESKNVSKSIHNFLSNYSDDFKSGQKVLIKPNWVNSRPDNTGATTNTRIIGEVITFFQKKKMKVIIAEGSGYEFDTAKTFRVLDVYNFKRRFGVDIINTRDSETESVDLNGRVLKNIELPKEVISADWIINIPKIKTHVLTGVTFCMKNLFGLLPDKERRFAHVFGLHQSIVDLASYFNKKTINILDGIIAMFGEGPVFGNTLNLNLIIGGRNAADIDKFCCGFLGINYRKIKHIELARNSFSEKVEVISNYNKEIPNFSLSTASKCYKFRYWGVFVFDFLLSKIIKKSLIPWIVTKFGVRLEIKNDLCDNCRKCVKICPENAIYIDPVSEFPKIDFEKCRYVRCFKCFDICEKKAFNIKGFSKPNKK